MQRIKGKLIGNVAYKPLFRQKKKPSGTAMCQLIIEGVEINGIKGQTLIGTAYGDDALAEYQMDGLVAFDVEFSVDGLPEIQDAEDLAQKVVFKNIQKICL